MTRHFFKGSGHFWIVSVPLAGVLIAFSGAQVLGQGGGGGGKPSGETAGNNLSFPVIWSDGVAKALPGTPEMFPDLEGEWWYWWGTSGTDPNVVPLSAPPDPDDPNFCDDGVAGTVGPPPGEGWVRAYLQKDPENVWQAGSADWSTAPVAVDWIDWGDNLESVDWYMTSQVRTEVVLFQDLDTPMLEYEMRHVSGWGIDEVHGMAVDGLGPIPGPGTRATVYSHCARLTIQKLQVPREELQEGDLEWVPETGWVTSDPEEDPMVNAPLFNMAVHEGGDGPGYYSAEINVKGRVIYGYTWNVRRLNEGPGDYRITFSFDETGTVDLNTFFVEGITDIIVPLEEELVEAALAEEEPTGAGAVPQLDPDNNLTYIDIRIHERSSGGGGGGTKGPPRNKGR